ncbi:MAG: hypothetical protein CMP11_01485 [Zetaproteobacteria bacterium]|nr:hypothetical protein [Pseudobdellovibrionaceae bacterium]|tara:strand:- start:68 stop:805 length:738 start_codon:yes stop_codon:yes gene_type:complete
MIKKIIFLGFFLFLNFNIQAQEVNDKRHNINWGYNMTAGKDKSAKNSEDGNYNGFHVRYIYAPTNGFYFATLARFGFGTRKANDVTLDASRSDFNIKFGYNAQINDAMSLAIFAGPQVTIERTKLSENTDFDEIESGLLFGLDLHYIASKQISTGLGLAVHLSTLETQLASSVTITVEEMKQIAYFTLRLPFNYKVNDNLSLQFVLEQDFNRQYDEGKNLRGVDFTDLGYDFNTSTLSLGLKHHL